MNFKKVLTKGNIVRTLLFVCAVTILSFFLPETEQTNKFKYEYEVGKPWPYGLLKSPKGDIKVDLNPKIVKARVDSINSIRITAKDNDVFSKVENDLKKDEALGVFYKTLSGKIKDFYDKGIVSDALYKDLSGESDIRFANQKGNYPELKAEDVYSNSKVILEIKKELPNALNLGDVLTSKLGKYIVPNIADNQEKTNKFRTLAIAKASAPEKSLQEGERIVGPGEKVTVDIDLKIKACQREFELGKDIAHYAHYPKIGQILFIIILLSFNYLFFKVFRKGFFKDLKKMTFMMFLITIFTFSVFFFSQKEAASVYIVPFVMIPILLTVFFDSRTAMYVHVTEIFLCSLVAPSPAEFIFVQFVAGITAIISLRELSRRSQLIRCAIFVLLAYSITYTVFIIIKNGSLLSFDYKIIIYFLINSVLLSFTYIAIFVFEKIFGFISPVTLIELSDVSNPLLRQLSEKCPGTLQHSLQVSSLAAEAAQKINANVLLVRAGALYHDIGKMNHPEYFTENQVGENPHKYLTPEQSAAMVVSHVTGGLDIAIKHNLPSVIRDFITQHHGKGVAKYFYTTACNNNPDVEIDIKKYQYPGPNPTSKETAIMMMADSTEAASRSLKVYNEETIRGLVNKIINSQIADGLLNDCPLSFREVETVKNTFVERLKSIYHTRVSYPELNKNKNTEK